jgi:hypothetical protein
MSIEAMKSVAVRLDCLVIKHAQEAVDLLPQAIEQAEQGNNNLNYPNAESNTSIEQAEKQETLILDLGCFERGCIAYDERDGNGVIISQERVDETVKQEHEPWCDSVTKLLLSMPPQIPPCNCKPKREWVGLTDEEMTALKQKSVMDGMTRIVSDFEYIRSIEAKLKEKNSGSAD